MSQGKELTEYKTDTKSVWGLHRETMIPLFTPGKTCYNQQVPLGAENPGFLGNGHRHEKAQLMVGLSCEGLEWGWTSKSQGGLPRTRESRKMDVIPGEGWSSQWEIISDLLEFLQIRSKHISWLTWNMTKRKHKVSGHLLAVWGWLKDRGKKNPERKRQADCDLYC